MIYFNRDLHVKEVGNDIEKSEWEALSPEKKRQERARKIRMAHCWNRGGRFPDERQQAIIDCTVDNVTEREVMNVISMCRRYGYSELTVGEIRIYYDDMIDDMEKKVRKELGLEYDYTHKVKYS